MLPAVSIGKPSLSGYPARYRAYIALLSREAWERYGREKPSFLRLAQGEAVTSRLPLIRGLGLRLATERAIEPGEAEGVLALRPDRVLQAQLHDVRGQLGIPALWNLHGRGRGVTVGVVDSGVYPHQDLVSPENRICAFQDLVLGRVRPYDDCGHGTHLAGIIAGSGSHDPLYTGLAPEARIASVKVLDSWGRGRESRVIAGIEWCVRWSKALGLKVLNLSFGAPLQGPVETDPCCLAVEEAWRRGIVVVAGAGRVGPGGAGSPGACPRIISVDADEQPDHRPVSNPGGLSGARAGPSVLAPGGGVVSLLSPHSRLDHSIKAAAEGRPPRGYVAMRGISVATAVVSGVSAVLVGESPDLAPDIVKETVIRMSSAWRGPPESST